VINAIAFSVPGEPQGKGRARIGKVGGFSRMFTPAKTVAYEGLVALAAQRAMADTGPFACALAVEIEAVHSIPASWSKKKRAEALSGAMHPTTKPDIDNIAKAIADGGNGVAWVDDKQITRLLVVRRYGETPGVHVRVAAMETP
jgi:Holliday junction resolvase RusA-like endonuclease